MNEGAIIRSYPCDLIIYQNHTYRFACSQYDCLEGCLDRKTDILTAYTVCAIAAISVVICAVLQIFSNLATLPRSNVNYFSQNGLRKTIRNLAEYPCVGKLQKIALLISFAALFFLMVVKNSYNPKNCSWECSYYEYDR